MHIKQRKNKKTPRQRREKVARGRAQNAKHFGAMPLDPKYKPMTATRMGRNIYGCCRVPYGTLSLFLLLSPGASIQNASNFVLCPWLPSLAAVAAFFYFSFA